MKAKINGIEVEGTPQEIHQLMVELGPVKIKTYPPQEFVPYDPSNIFSTKATASTKRGCTANGPCYCTGACMN